MKEDTEKINEAVKIEDYELFESAIDNFILEIDALAESLPLTIGLIQIQYESNIQNLERFFEIKNRNDDKTFKIPVDDFNEFNRLSRELKSSEAAYTILPRTFVVSLVSQYDAYIGEIYRNLFQIVPELIFSLEKEMSFSDILTFESLDELKGFQIEKEVENLLRNSHFEQFKTLERRITSITKKEFKLTSQLKILPTFIEVTERRNLFVHCNGIVSRQYLDVCKKHKVSDISKVNINDQLDVEPLYFEKAYHAIFEVGVKLGQVLWRKFLPDKIEEANLNINSICYDLLVTGYYDLAKELLLFATEVVPKKGSEEMFKILMINRALSYYLDGDKKGCLEILNKEDWSIGNEFKLATAVLKEDYDLARKMMLKIGLNDEKLDKDAYQEWPLFLKFREDPIFKQTFKELFNEEFVIRKLPEKNFKGLLDSIKRKKKNER